MSKDGLVPSLISDPNNRRSVGPHANGWARTVLAATFGSLLPKYAAGVCPGTTVAFGSLETTFANWVPVHTKRPYEPTAPVPAYVAQNAIRPVASMTGSPKPVNVT